MYMETTVFILCILLGIAVIALGIIASLQIVTGSSERKELQKLLKARDLPEYTTFAEKPEEEEIEDTSNLVELENMDSVIQEAIEKNGSVQRHTNSSRPYDRLCIMNK